MNTNEWRTPEDSESPRADRHEQQSELNETLTSLLAKMPHAADRNENATVVWNHQRCFDWVTPIDVLQAELGNSRSEHDSPVITILEIQQGPVVPLLDGPTSALAEIKQLLEGISERQERIVVPLAEHNRELRNDAIDNHIVRPLLNTVIQILDRLEDEMREAGHISASGPSVNERRVDREEYRQLLERYGVAPRYWRRGTPFQAQYHQVTQSRATTAPADVGRLSRTLRPAYVRSRNREVIRKAWVEVYSNSNSVKRFWPERTLCHSTRTRTGKAPFSQ